jgi:hypothetical protein
LQGQAGTLVLTGPQKHSPFAPSLKGAKTERTVAIIVQVRNQSIVFLCRQGVTKCARLSDGKPGSLYDDWRQSIAPPLAYYGVLRRSTAHSLHIGKAVFGIPHRGVALRDKSRMAKACRIGYHLSWRDRNERTKKQKGS